MAKSQPYDYEIMDPFKLAAQEAALTTTGNSAGHGYPVVPESYGESVSIIDMGPFYLAAVLEGIGTKNVVADIVDENSEEESHYGAIAQCDMATRFNDLTTSGARPFGYLGFIATGEDKWFENRKRAKALTLGYAAVCNEFGVTWLGGESQALVDVVMPGRSVLAGALLGDITPKSRYITGEDLQAGDAMTMIGSSGIHANGLSGMRRLAEKLPDKYNTRLSDGTSFGEALLRPTYIYSNLVQRLLDKTVEIHRIEHITGHGWRKIMRSGKQYTYRIDQVPELSALYKFIQEQTGLDDGGMYGTYNADVGYVVFSPEGEVENIVNTAEDLGFKAWRGGTVEEGPKRVVIEPKSLVFESDSLAIR